MRIVFFVGIVLMFGSPGVSFADTPPPPFSPGERLTFQLKWGVIPAGEAVLEVLPIEKINGEPAYHFALTARSNSFVDLFYKVRDHIDAFTDINLTRSLLYKKKQREGDTNRDIVVRFDWENSTAVYTDRNRRKPPVAIAAGCFDPLSIFYYARTLDLETGRIFGRPVSDGKKCVIGQARVVQRETVEINGTAYDTVLLEPDLKDIGGVFQKSKDAKIKIWVTADHRRIPVMIQSKVVVGSFVGEIMRMTEGVPHTPQRPAAAPIPPVSPADPKPPADQSVPTD